jgi:hypothetical protein
MKTNREPAADSDVDDYYRSLAARPAPNRSKNSNLQTDQAPHDLSPADGGDGFIGSETGPEVGFDYVTGKKGYTQDKPIWDKQSSFTDYPDNAGSDLAKDVSHEEDSRDEKAPWKKVDTSEGLPQTGRTNQSHEGVPLENLSARDDGGGNPDTQSVPSAESPGDKEFSDMPQTDFTSQDGGGAPQFKHSGPDRTDALYRPKPRG